MRPVPVRRARPWVRRETSRGKISEPAGSQAGLGGGWAATRSLKAQARRVSRAVWRAGPEAAETGRMAIVLLGRSRCPLCEEVISDDRPYMATSMVTLASPDLERYPDSAMHWECYLRWPDRLRFAQEYLLAGPLNEALPHWAVAYDDGRVAVTTNGLTARAWLWETATCVSFTRDSWPEPSDNDDSHHPLELAEFAELCAKETWESLMSRVDWSAVERRTARFHAAIAARQEQHHEELIEANAENQRLGREWAERLARRLLACPRCQRREVKFYPKPPEQKCFFICQSCGRSFHPDAPTDW